MELAEFDRQITDRGWCIFPECLSVDLVNRLATDLEVAYANCRQIQIENGLDNTEGTVHHLIGQGDSFMEYLALFEGLNEYTESFFGGKYILNAMGGNILKKGMSYAAGIHRDMRSFSGALPLMLNTMVMLDDFTHENGATWLMHRGHIQADIPTEDDFTKQAFQVMGKAGSIVFFNSNLWHKAGDNRTDKSRRLITPMFTKPFYKQQFDYSQFCNENSSPWLKQVLGWNSRTPATLKQWYQPKETRFYKDNQG